jgi:hypothetical protein
MELLLPSIGLLTWTILALVSFVLTIIALISVAGNKQLDVAAKFIWAVLIIFVPTLGPILYFINCKPNKRNTAF